MNIEYDTYYDNQTKAMTEIAEHEITALTIEIANAVYKRTGEKIKDWQTPYQILSEIAEYVYATDENEIEKNLINKFNSYDIHPKLNEIDLEEVVWEALGY